VRLLSIVPVVAGAALLARHFSPGAGRVCERIFERMPEDFPPKRMFLNVAAIREQNERIISLLEQHIEASG
jgi:hypothetical protein